MKKRSVSCTSSCLTMEAAHKTARNHRRSLKRTSSLAYHYHRLWRPQEEAPRAESRIQCTACTCNYALLPFARNNERDWEGYNSKVSSAKISKVCGPIMETTVEFSAGVEWVGLDRTTVCITLGLQSTWSHCGSLHQTRSVFCILPVVFIVYSIGVSAVHYHITIPYNTVPDMVLRICTSSSRWPVFTL